MGDIGAIANVCNTDLQEPADDSASAGRDEDFHAPTRRYHDISVFMTPPPYGNPQIPTHHRIPARRHGRNPELPTQLRAPTAKNAQQPQDANLTRGSRHARRAATPSYGYICRLRCFREAPDIPQVGPAHRHRRPHQPSQATPARHLRPYSTLTRYSAPTCPAIAVTVALPRPTAVTMPLWSTFTTLGLVLPHTMPSR